MKKRIWAFGWLVVPLIWALTACGKAAPPAPPSGPPASIAATQEASPLPSITVPAPTPSMAPTATLPATALPTASPTAWPTPVIVLSPLPATITPTFTPWPTLPPPTFTATWTPSATPSATPTPTQALATTPYDLGPPDMLDPMDIPGRHWYVWGNPYVRPKVVPGALRLIVDKPSDITYWIRSDYPPLSDAYIQGVFRTGDSCHHKDRYGLVVRSPNSYEGYLFVISCDGMYKIFRWNGGLLLLHDWERTMAIHTGGRQINRVGVWMEGTSLRLFVNNTLVAEVQDDKYTEGSFGILVGADATHGFTVDVEEVAYWHLPQPIQK